LPWDPASVARSALSIDGAIPASAGPRTVLDLRGRSTIAVDGDADYVARRARRGRLRRRASPPPGPPSPACAAASRSAAEATDSREPFVVLVDAVGAHSPQRDVIEQLAAVRPSAIVVNVGVAGGRLPLAAVHTRARAASLPRPRARRSPRARGTRSRHDRALAAVRHLRRRHRRRRR
jgi:beta-N-acetylhexosaminidase